MAEAQSVLRNLFPEYGARGSLTDDSNETPRTALLEQYGSIVEPYEPSLSEKIYNFAFDALGGNEATGLDRQRILRRARYPQRIIDQTALAGITDYSQAMQDYARGDALSGTTNLTMAATSLIPGQQRQAVEGISNRLLKGTSGRTPVTNPSALRSLPDAPETKAPTIAGQVAPAEALTPLAGLPPMEGRVISERFPTATKSTEDPLKDFLKADIQTLMTDQSQANKISNTLRSYVNYRGGASDPKTVIESMKEHSVDNLNFIFDQMPEEIRNRASMWYDGANRKANELAQRYGIKNESVAGVIAAMSPQKDWYQNVSLAERVIDIAKTKSNIPLDSNIYKIGLEKLKNKDQLMVLESIKGKMLSEITNPIERAVWVRMFDETYNPREYNIYSPEGDKLGLYMTAKGEPRKVAWGSFNEITKALQVIDDPSIQNISTQMGKQHKVRNFYNNIIMPSNQSSITADTHAVAAALMRPLGGSATEVSHNLGSAASSSMTGIQGTYPIFADAYRDVARSRGILPRQAQSIAWEGVRGLFSPEQKRDKALLGEINNIMLKYQNGKMTQREMQNAILNEAGGITKPDWAR